MNCVHARCASWLSGAFHASAAPASTRRFAWIPAQAGQGGGPPRCRAGNIEAICAFERHRSMSFYVSTGSNESNTYGMFHTSLPWPEDLSPRSRKELKEWIPAFAGMTETTSRHSRESGNPPEPCRPRWKHRFGQREMMVLRGYRCDSMLSTQALWEGSGWRPPAAPGRMCRCGPRGR